VFSQIAPVLSPLDWVGAKRGGLGDSGQTKPRERGPEGMPSLQSPHWTRESKHGRANIEENHTLPGPKALLLPEAILAAGLSGSRVCWTLRASSWVLLSTRWPPNLLAKTGPLLAYLPYRAFIMRCDRPATRAVRNMRCLLHQNDATGRMSSAIQDNK
jgi:hypothetical protein